VREMNIHPIAAACICRRGVRVTAMCSSALTLQLAQHKNNFIMDQEGLVMRSCTYAARPTHFIARLGGRYVQRRAYKVEEVCILSYF
jgi:hypothetical protein